MADWYVNGRPLSTLSLYLQDAGDSRSLAPLKYDPVTLYQRYGGVVGAAPSVAARSLTLRGKIVTSANTVAARVAAEDTIKDLFANGGLLTVELRDDIAPAREIDAYCESLTLQPFGHPLLAVASTVECRLLAPDALWRATTGMIIGVPATSTRYSLPLGTAPSSPLLRVFGSATNPTVTIRDTGGVAQVTLAFTVSLTSSEYLEVDCTTGVITKVSSGTRTNGVSLLTSGTFPFRLDPAWGDPSNSLWPTIETSAGVADILYARRYA